LTSRIVEITSQAADLNPGQRRNRAQRKRTHFGDEGLGVFPFLLRNSIPIPHTPSVSQFDTPRRDLGVVLLLRRINVESVSGLICGSLLRLERSKRIQGSLVGVNGSYRVFLYCDRRSCLTLPALLGGDLCFRRGCPPSEDAKESLFGQYQVSEILS
jgi:hypothetical protein